MEDKALGTAKFCWAESQHSALLPSGLPPTLAKCSRWTEESSAVSEAAKMMPELSDLVILKDTVLHQGQRAEWVEKVRV